MGLRLTAGRAICKASMWTCRVVAAFCALAIIGSCIWSAEWYPADYKRVALSEGVFSAGMISTADTMPHGLHVARNRELPRPQSLIQFQLANLGSSWPTIEFPLWAPALVVLLLAFPMRCRLGALRKEAGCCAKCGQDRSDLKLFAACPKCGH